MASKKWNFRTPVDEPKKTTTPSGDKIEEVMAMKLDAKGNQEFYVEGKTNVYKKIQAYADDVDIEKIMLRYIDTGDPNILQKVKGTYTDITEMPKTMIEAHARLQDAENSFNALPLEIRKAYGFNFNEYLKDVGSEQWMDLMGFNKKDNTIPVQTETKEEVTD